MIINNVDELKQYLDSLFSSSCKNIKEREREKMKEAIDTATKNIPKANETIKYVCKYELEHDRLGEFNNSKIFFCMQRLSQEENKEIILCFIEKEKYWFSDRKKELFIKMLDILNEDKDKIKIVSKLSCENLFKFMSDMNFYIKREKFSKKKYYKNYYNIFKEALELKSQR